MRPRTDEACRTDMYALHLQSLHISNKVDLSVIVPEKKDLIRTLKH